MLGELASEQNFLLLDEPTNDLDLATISALEDFVLDEFDGVLIVVSHARYFLDKVADHLLVLPADGTGRVDDWTGSFTEYLDYREEELEAERKKRQEAAARGGSRAQPPRAPSADDASAGDATTKKVKPLSEYERKQLARLEVQLGEIGDEQAELQARVDGFSGDGYAELQEWTERIGELAERAAEMEVKWLELAERDEGAAS